MYSKTTETPSSYQRSTYLNPNIDMESITSVFDEGILTVDLPKIRRGTFSNAEGMLALARPVDADPTTLSTENPSTEQKSIEPTGTVASAAGDTTEAQSEGHHTDRTAGEEILAKLNVISLKSHTGAHVTAMWWSGEVICNRKEAMLWEFWTINKIGYDGHYSFRSHHGKYLCAELDGRVVANRERALEWEWWTLHQLEADHFYLKSHHGKYLRVTSDGELMTADWPDSGEPHKWILSPTKSSLMLTIF